VPLAYVEWFTRQAVTPNKNHGMYQISRAYDSQGRIQGSVIPLSNIRQSCMLFPIFPKSQTGTASSAHPFEDWTPENTLDRANRFLVNNFLHKYAYQTVW